MLAVMIALGLMAAQAQLAPLSPPSAEVSADHRALEALNNAWLNSYVARDPGVLDSILADDFIAVYGGGQRRTKAQLLERVRNGPQVVSVRPENVQIQISGDVAIVTARSVLMIRIDGEVRETRNDYADIYVRRDGRWRGVSAHIVRVASNP